MNASTTSHSTSPAETATSPTETATSPTEVATDPARSLHWSILISAVRCTLTYVILPFVAPFIGLAPGVGPLIGIPLALVALAANAFSIKRHWVNNHRWKWPVSVLNVGIIVLLLVLLTIDINDLLS